MNEKRTGIWIPVELMMDKQLDWSNKVLLTEILSLHKLPDGCFASNDQLAELLGIEKSAASKRISKLKKLGYIQTKDVYDRNFCVGRIITPITKVPQKDLPEQKNKKRKDLGKQHEEKANKDSNEGRVESSKHLPDLPEGSSDKNHTSLTEKQVGSSQTTIGVVPEQLGGSSHGNTINTSINTDIKKQLLYQYTGETDSFNSVDDLIISEDSLPKIQEEQIITISTRSNNSCDAGNKSILPKISTKEYRAIMNDFFEGYSSWEADLYSLGLERFIDKTQYYHSNYPEYIDMIREFFEL